MVAIIQTKTIILEKKLEETKEEILAICNCTVEANFY